jgi:hypothetical protein
MKREIGNGKNIVVAIAIVNGIGRLNAPFFVGVEGSGHPSG